MEKEARKNQIVKPSWFLIRLIDCSKSIDFLLAFIIGAWPICLAYIIGADDTTGSYAGYMDTPNWWSLAIILPTILLAFRWSMSKISPVLNPQFTQNTPPIINLLRDNKAKMQVYDQLRQSMLSKNNFLISFIIVAIIHILDMPTIFAPYISGKSNGFDDWSSMFLLENSQISKSANLLLLISAGIAQFCTVFIGALTIILFLRHNLFFMRHVYQRHQLRLPVGDNNTENYFHIDVNDVNRCFGFRIANEAFNTQVKALMIAGVAMFLSRYMFVSHSQGCVLDFSSFQSVSSCLISSFSLPSQSLMALLWLIALFIVSMPAFVKLLPRMPYRGSDRIDLSVENYLQEFFSDETWPRDKFGNHEPVTVVANKFARNSFWPTGDNRAHVLFLFSYWIFFIILLPPVKFDFVTLSTTFIVFGVVAYAVKSATFHGLKWALRYVDDMLVADKDVVLQEEPETTEKSDIRVFISYRRSDSAPYARSIHEKLLEYFYKENIFMDINNIKPGVKFGQEIDKALNSVDTVIALIGREWAMLKDENGKPRIDVPEDMVRYEIATALKLGKRVIPVLVGGAKMPQEKQLPDPLKELSQFNAIELSEHRWAYDMNLLVKALNSTN